MDTLSSGVTQRRLQVHLGCVRLSPSCPFRLLHTFPFPGQRAITPAFGYSAPHPGARGTLTLLNSALLSAHYKRGPTSTVASVSLRFGLSVDILSPLQPAQDGGGPPRCHDASISDHAVLSDPAGVSSDHRLLRSPTVAFQIFDPVGPRIYHEAQSLHLRYGLAIALSTLNPCRYLHEPKTRFPVGRLFPFPGRELHPLKAPGLSWRTERIPQFFIQCSSS